MLVPCREVGIGKAVGLGVGAAEGGGTISAVVELVTSSAVTGKVFLSEVLTVTMQTAVAIATTVALFAAFIVIYRLQVDAL